MHRSILLILALIFPALAVPAPLRFQKICDHYYFLQSPDSAANIGALVTDSGILLVNPPLEKAAPPVMEALKRASQKPVRWIIDTDYRSEMSPLAGQGVDVLASGPLWERGVADTGSSSSPAASALVFPRQMRLYPAGIEVRLFAPQVKSRTADTTVVFIPAEKVLQVGGIFEPASFPRFEPSPGEGAAVAWMDALKQIVDLVPVLKSAMPAPKPDPAKTPAEEKTLEQTILIVPAHGAVSNLQDLRQLLDTAQRIRAELGRAVTAGRSRNTVAALPSIAQYRSWGNFEAFVLQLYDDLSAAH